MSGLDTASPKERRPRPTRSATRAGKHFRDPSIPPPLDAEFTARSVRFTVRASVFVATMSFIAIATGAYYDVASRFDHLTWMAVVGGRGAGAAIEFRVSRGDLALFAATTMALAAVPMLVGALRMASAVRSGRPHHGPTAWTAIGATLAAALGIGTVLNFMISDLFSPGSDAVVVTAMTPYLTGLFVGIWLSIHLQFRYDPWRPLGREAVLDPPAKGGRVTKRAGARVAAISHDPATSVLTATYADGAQYEYAWVSTELHDALTAGPGGLDLHILRTRVISTKSFRRAGEDHWRSPPSTVETGVECLDRKALALTSLLGERPPHPRVRARRAPRANGRRVRVNPAGVWWRTRAGRSGHIPADRIEKVHIVGSSLTGSSTLYALVISPDGDVLLRVSSSGVREASTAERRRHLRQLWSPLGVPVDRQQVGAGRTKDARRRWPEAFTWAHAHPVMASVLIAAAYVGVAGPLAEVRFGQ